MFQTTNQQWIQWALHTLGRSAKASAINVAASESRDAGSTDSDKSSGAAMTKQRPVRGCRGWVYSHDTYFIYINIYITYIHMYIYIHMYMYTPYIPYIYIYMYVSVIYFRIFHTYLTYFRWCPWHVIMFHHASSCFIYHIHSTWNLDIHISVTLGCDVDALVVILVEKPRSCHNLILLGEVDAACAERC